VSLAGGRRPVVRDSLPAVSIAGALSPWCVVRVPFALVLELVVLELVVLELVGRGPWAVGRGP
jgi:hypothetical protein